MSRGKSEDRKLAFQMWKKSGGTLSLTEIACELKKAVPTISKWKKEDRWEELYKREPVQNGRGAPPGNKNSFKHGFYAKHIPTETLELMAELESKDPVEVLRENINLQFAAIVRSQGIMFVSDKDDMTKELKKLSDGDTSSSREYIVQFAWDKQAAFLNAQSKAIGTLEKLIARYEELCGPKFELEKLKVKRLKQDITLVKEQIKSSKETGKANNSPVVIVDDIS